MSGRRMPCIQKPCHKATGLGFSQKSRGNNRKSNDTALALNLEKILYPPLKIKKHLLLRSEKKEVEILARMTLAVVLSPPRIDYSGREAFAPLAEDLETWQENQKTLHLFRNKGLIGTMKEMDVVTPRGSEERGGQHSERGAP